MNEPVFIIGAGRSGTNMLRDILCRLEDFGTWPCDEINYIWRHGNIAKGSDRFTAKDAHPSVAKYIQKQFKKFQKQSTAPVVVEKTCATSLKVPFVNEIFPNAKYIFIIRHGMDVTSSAKKRWTASLDIKYILKKARFVPFSDFPYYGFRYFKNRIVKFFSKEKRLAFWGPLYPGMQDDLKLLSLDEVCAKQWATCVTTAYNDLKTLSEDQVIYIRYEDFVINPLDHLRDILTFLDKSFSEEEIKYAVGEVSIHSIGNYKKHLSLEQQELAKVYIDPVITDIYEKLV